MTNFLKTTWSKYKALAWWKKLLLAIPFLALAAICVVLLFVGFGRGDRLSEHVEHHKKQVDKQIAKNDKREDTLKKREQAIATEQKKVEEEIKDNQKQAAEVIHSIDAAVKANDLNELERLRKQINGM